MDTLILKIKKTIADHGMVESGDRVLLGVSGGPDSVVLLHSLVALKDELNIELTIAHLNHSARGEESDRDAQFVKNLGEELQINTRVVKMDVAAHQANVRGSFQETARHLRLDFFQKTMREMGANKIALGHTLDDQAETVLMNLLRGSGLQGIGGMSPVRLPYIRPMFDCSRAEIMDFLKDEKIPFCNDSSNEKSDYLRNRVRLELIPFLQEKYNPRITENLFEAADIFRTENDYLLTLENHEFERAVLKFEDNETLTMDTRYFTSLPLALKRRLVRKGIESIKGDLRRISFFHVQEVLHLFEKGQKGKRIGLPGNVEVWFREDHVEFKRIRGSGNGILSGDVSQSPDWIRRLAIPGETLVEQAGLTLKTEIIDFADPGFSASRDQAFLDFDKTGDDINVRFLQAGDRLTPLGMEGTKKLKSLFIDEKVPQEIRSTVPILTTGDNDIIWVYGMRIAHAYRVTSDTNKVLFIKGLT